MHQRFLWCLGCNSLKADSQALLTSRFIVLFATPDTQCQVLRYLALSFGDQQLDSEIMISWSEWNLWCICVSFNRTALNASFYFPLFTSISLSSTWTVWRRRHGRLLNGCCRQNFTKLPLHSCHWLQRVDIYYNFYNSHQDVIHV